MEDLTGRHVVVTGGARGIGLEAAIGCASAGASVTVLSRTRSDLDQAAARLQATGAAVKFLALSADVTDDESLTAALRQATMALGPVYGLVCAAGVYGAIGPFSDVDFEAWERTIAVNLVGTARSIRLVIPLMATPPGGRVILFSGGGQGPMPNFSDYVTSKGGIWRLTEVLGAELAGHEIYVNAIAPGAVNTRLLDELLAAGPERTGRSMYRRSLEQKEQGGESPARARDLILYLLSDYSAGLYGKTLSALWDDYRSLEDPSGLSRSDIYCHRRVVDHLGNTRVTQ